MSLKINRCLACGEFPEIEFDESNWDFILYCHCKFPERNSHSADSLQELVKRWNEVNWYEWYLADKSF